VKKLTELRGREVLDRQGRSFGRVHEVRCRPSPSRATHQEAPQVAELLCGSGGIRARFGVRPGKLQPVAWADIVEFREGRLWARIDRPGQ
jgi:hypothetical protein